MLLKRKPKKIRIGLRTLKTAAAVVLSMFIVSIYGATTSRLTFAMLGAMAAMEPTFKESLKSCATQTVGVFFGAMVAVLLLKLPISPILSAGIGIVLVITSYNYLNIRFSPSLPCLIVVTLCITPDIQPFTYALGRFWDTAIGLGVGILINTLIFPYDNREQIRDTMESLDHEVLYFLEDMFDGDNFLPNTKRMYQTVAALNRQLTVFSNQWPLLNLRQNRQELETFQICERKARQLIAQMEVLCRMDQPGILSTENLLLLSRCGAEIRDSRHTDEPQEEDIVTNYHVRRLLTLRQELLELLKG